MPKRATRFTSFAVEPNHFGTANGSLVLTLADAGQTIHMSNANAQTFTLPAATGTASRFEFFVSKTALGDKVFQVANSTDEFAGIVYQVDTDTGDALVAYPCVAADNFDTLTLNGSTKGGLAGDKIVFIDMSDGFWSIEAHTMCTGTAASPLSAAV